MESGAGNNGMQNAATLTSQKMKIAAAKLRGDASQDLYVAVQKATLATEVVPKEKHVRTLKIACNAMAPRGQVEYVIYKLSKRLTGNGWLVTLKALMVLHRLMRECDPSFQDTMLRMMARNGRHRLLALDRFADHSTKDTWDYSAWIRVYSLFLDERLDCYRTTHWDPELEGQPRMQLTQQQHAAMQAQIGAGFTGQTYYAQQTGMPPNGPISSGMTGAANGRAGANNVMGPPAVQQVDLKTCEGAALLERLPRVQKLWARLMACQPEGSSSMHPVVLTAAAWVLRESRSIYKVCSEGVMNLADKFFEMERADALVGVELYKEHMALNEKLNAYYGIMQSNPALRTVIPYPQLEAMPSDFLQAMEEYVRDAPKEADPNAPGRRAGGPVTNSKLSSVAALGGTTSAALGGPGSPKLAEPKPESPKAPEPEPVAPPPPPKAPEVDLLGFDDDEPLVTEAPKPAAAANGELDFLADGMANGGAGQANGNGDANGFGEQPPAWGQQQQMQPQYTGMQPGMEAYGNPFGMQPQYTGMQQSMAIVPVGPMGGMPMYPMGYGGYLGYGPFAGPTGMMAGPTGGIYAGPTGGVLAGPTGSAGSNNPFNPFNSQGPPQQGPLSAVRMTDDPLNSLTEDLLNTKLNKLPTGPQPSLKDLKSQTTSPAPSPVPQPQQ